MDLVINHTSTDHDWFKKSIDLGSNYHDYYIWKKPRHSLFNQDLPPNNWTSFFTGSAWEKCPINHEYYLHLFTKEQADLNYRNPAVIQEIEKIMLFWLNLGVSGFRCDVINLIYKNSFSNGKFRLYARGLEHYLSTNSCHNILKQINHDVLQPYQAFTVGEANHVTLNQAKKFTTNHNELTTVFSFDHIMLPILYKPKKLKKALIKWQTGLDWNTVFFENHDNLRSISVYGLASYHLESAKMLATLLLSLRGTTFIYQGEEIGMTDYPFTDINQIKDIVDQKVYQVAKKFLTNKLAFKIAMMVCRDNSRTPMQWNSGFNAGFSKSKTTWLAVNPNYTKINVAAEQADENSILNYYKKLIELKTSSRALTVGQINFIKSNHNTLVFSRDFENEHYLIIVNLSKKIQTVKIKINSSILFSNYSNKINYHKGSLKLKPFESLVLKNN